jgi:hypothetical protein
MKTKPLLCLAALSLALAFLTTTTTMAKADQRITLEQLETMFADMRARAPWNVDGPLLWGYFFYDRNPQKLEKAAAELSQERYRVVSIEKVNSNVLYRLHVEKVETHSPSSLHARNQALYLFAEKHGLASYDGMDVGRPPK